MRWWEPSRCDLAARFGEKELFGSRELVGAKPVLW